jgi:hypothetical protein
VQPHQQQQHHYTLPPKSLPTSTTSARDRDTDIQDGNFISKALSMTKDRLQNHLTYSGITPNHSSSSQQVTMQTSTNYQPPASAPYNNNNRFTNPHAMYDNRDRPPAAMSMNNNSNTSASPSHHLPPSLPAAPHIEPPQAAEWMIDKDGNETKCSAVNPILLALPCFWIHLCMLMPCICFGNTISQYDVTARSDMYNKKQLKQPAAKIRKNHTNSVECKGKQYLFNPDMPVSLQQQMAPYGLDADLFSAVVNDVKEQLVLNVQIGQRQFSLGNPAVMTYRRQKQEYYKQLLICKWSQMGIMLQFNNDDKMLYITMNTNPQVQQYNDNSNHSGTNAVLPISSTAGYNHGGASNVIVNDDIAPPPYSG